MRWGSTACSYWTVRTCPGLPNSVTKTTHIPSRLSPSAAIISIQMAEFEAVDWHLRSSVYIFWLSIERLSGTVNVCSLLLHRCGIWHFRTYEAFRGFVCEYSTDYGGWAVKSWTRPSNLLAVQANGRTVSERWQCCRMSRSCFCLDTHRFAMCDAQLGLIWTHLSPLRFAFWGGMTSTHLMIVLGQILARIRWDCDSNRDR